MGLDHFLAVRLEIVSYCSQFARPKQQRTFPSTVAHATVTAPSFDVAAENSPRISHRRRYVAAPATDLQRKSLRLPGEVWNASTGASTSLLLLLPFVFYSSVLPVWRMDWWFQVSSSFFKVIVVSKCIALVADLFSFFSVLCLFPNPFWACCLKLSSGRTVVTICLSLLEYY